MAEGGGTGSPMFKNPLPILLPFPEALLLSPGPALLRLQPPRVHTPREVSLARECTPLISAFGLPRQVDICLRPLWPTQFLLPKKKVPMTTATIMRSKPLVDKATGPGQKTAYAVDNFPTITFLPTWIHVSHPSEDLHA